MLAKLQELSKDFDDVIHVLRGSEVDRKFKIKSLIVLWLLLPFLSLIEYKNVFKGLKNVNFTPSLPLLAGSILAPLVSLFSEMNWLQLMGIGLLIGYIISFALAPLEMVKFTSPYFHLGAYALFRKQEYQLFKKALLDDVNPLYFGPIYDYISMLLTKENLGQHELKLIHDRIDSFLNSEKSEYKSHIKVLEERFKEKQEEHVKAIKDYDQQLEKLVKSHHELHKGLGWVIEFIKATTTSLYRKKNNYFSYADLARIIGCGVTIYEIQGEQLVKIADEGTSGHSPKVISINDSKYEEWAVVKVAGDEKVEEKIDEPYPGRFVVARRMLMSYGKEWIINFHFDETDDRALFLIVTDDIIDTKEVFRMIHSICLLKQEKDQRGEGNNGSERTVAVPDSK